MNTSLIRLDPDLSLDDNLKQLQRRADEACAAYTVSGLPSQHDQALILLQAATTLKDVNARSS